VSIFDLFPKQLSHFDGLLGRTKAIKLASKKGSICEKKPKKGQKTNSRFGCDFCGNASFCQVHFRSFAASSSASSSSFRAPNHQLFDLFNFELIQPPPSNHSLSLSLFCYFLDGFMLPNKRPIIMNRSVFDLLLSFDSSSLHFLFFRALASFNPSTTAANLLQLTYLTCRRLMNEHPLSVTLSLLLSSLSCCNQVPFANPFPSLTPLRIRLAKDFQCHRLETNKSLVNPKRLLSKKRSRKCDWYEEQAISTSRF
jgi:hypothetical protein